VSQRRGFNHVFLILIGFVIVFSTPRHYDRHHNDPIQHHFCDGVAHLQPQSSVSPYPSRVDEDQTRLQAMLQLSQRLEAQMARYGYDKFDTSLIQNADLFLTKAGDEIITHLFTFERGGIQLALRPEFTASAAHAYIQRYPLGAAVVRWQFNGLVFQDDLGHDVSRCQRHHIGAELIGAGGAAADAEIIAMAAQGVSEIGLGSAQVIIGHVGLMKRLLNRFHLDAQTARLLLANLTAFRTIAKGKQYVLDLVDRLLMGKVETLSDDDPTDLVASSDESTLLNTRQILDVLLDATQHGVTMGGRTRQDIVRRLLHKRQRAAERPQIIAAVDFLDAYSALDGDFNSVFESITRMIDTDDGESKSILNELQQTIDLLMVYGLSANHIRVRPALARNWEYYTGIIFELGTQGGAHIGGGGRYDELARLLGGARDIPAVGFVYYADEIAALTKSHVTAPSIVYSLTAKSQTVAAQWATGLRGRGIPVRLLLDRADTADLTVNADDTLTYNGKSYLLSQIDNLIDALGAAPR